jgi:hypothetical protein
MRDGCLGGDTHLVLDHPAMGTCDKFVGVACTLEDIEVL